MVRLNRKWINHALILGLLFGSFQLLLGLNMVQMLQRSEDEISLIVEDQVSGLNQIQSLTRAAGNVHRAVLNLMLANSAKDLEWAHQRLAFSIAEIDNLIAAMPESRKVGGKHAVEAWTAYKEAVHQIEGASDRKDSVLAGHLRTELLRPRFESLQLANSEWADATEAEARSRAGQIKVEFGKTRKVLMALATAPLLFGAVLCSGVVLVFIWLFFRLPDESEILPKS